MRLSEICGSCKAEFHYRGLRHWWLVREWRAEHKCEGAAFTYLFQSAEMPTYTEWEDES